MSRSGYTDDCDDDLAAGRWRGIVAKTIRSKRGQAFLRELAAMDAMPEKILIADELVNAEGDCCTIGVVCKARGLDVRKVDYECPEQVGGAVGIARQMVAEIEYLNDEDGERWDSKLRRYVSETPAERWHRMRKWVDRNLLPVPA